MGMYTDLTCTAKIKPEFQDRIHKIVFEDAEWKDVFTEDSEEFYFVDLENADHIPFMDTCLSEEDIKQMFVDGVLKIDCDIMDYHGELDAFFELLKYISVEITEFITHYEEARDYDYKTDMWTYYNKNYLTGEMEEVKVPEAEIQRLFEEACREEK